LKIIDLIPSYRDQLASSSQAASVRIVRRTHRDREHADLGDDSLISGGGGRGLSGLSGGNCSGEDEDDDEGAYDMFHNGIPLKLYSQKKISLDKANEVTIGYIME
jgi:hypothetical protein